MRAWVDRWARLASAILAAALAALWLSSFRWYTTVGFDFERPAGPFVATADPSDSWEPSGVLADHRLGRRPVRADPISRGHVEPMDRPARLRPGRHLRLAHRSTAGKTGDIPGKGG